MPIPWKAIQRVNSQNRAAAALHYIQHVVRSRVDTEELAQKIAARIGVFSSRSLYPRRNRGSPSLTDASGSATPKELARVHTQARVNFRSAPELRVGLRKRGDRFTGEVVGSSGSTRSPSTLNYSDSPTPKHSPSRTKEATP